MYFLINELSFEGQYVNKYDANTYMKNIELIIQELKALKEFNLYTHHNLSQHELCPLYTVRDWLVDYTKDLHKNRDFLILILSLFKKDCISEYLNEEIKNGLYCLDCFFKGESFSSSSLAGAAYFKGTLISISKSKDYDVPFLDISFVANECAPENVKIHNIIYPVDAKKVVPKYEYSRKHEPLAPFPDATPMDLDDNEAQEALKIGLPFGIPSKKYSYYKGKCYEFKSSNASSPDGYPLYHGFPVDEGRVPHLILAELKK